MNLVLAFLSLLLSIPAHASKNPPNNLSCSAIYRTLDERNHSVERTVDVPVKMTLGDLLKYEAELEGRFFSLTEDQQAGDLFAQITQGPDYTKGIVVRGAPDSQGRFTATDVDGVTIYRLECARRSR